MRKTTILLPILVIVILGLMSSIFIVDERQRALVLQFGRVVSVKQDPGLAFKIPIIQEVVRYDDRILSRDIDPLEVTPLDDRRLVVDAFARYRITDVRRFRQAVGVGGEAAAAGRLDGILRDELRAVLGQVSSQDILSVDRAELMRRIRDGARPDAEELGLTLLDVRLKRTDLPPSNLNATFERMIAERDREAADEVARGNEAAQRTRATADRTVVELVSDANRQAEITRGEADARRNRIYAEAFGADPEFFEFYRSMAAYQTALRQGNTRMVMSPDSEFFSYLRTDNPGEVQGSTLSPEEATRVQQDTEANAGPDGEPGVNIEEALEGLPEESSLRQEAPEAIVSGESDESPEDDGEAALDASEGSSIGELLGETEGDEATAEDAATEEADTATDDAATDDAATDDAAAAVEDDAAADDADAATDATDGADADEAPAEDESEG
ncbi:protease modulator HflC [Pelagovum pacificum]|uniref:Protease modulator HflC n=1 Tax=Pelagovum pacificum TaxID=2588711 RepID=A0A5C5GD18_9RHOB|nr:protease modulator HflC [Pelagovum pacificum]TNY32705.1 protease modulator HflC [Pelagovum pacificum]